MKKETLLKVLEILEYKCILCQKGSLDKKKILSQKDKFWSRQLYCCSYKCREKHKKYSKIAQAWHELRKVL